MYKRRKLAIWRVLRGAITYEPVANGKLHMSIFIPEGPEDIIAMAIKKADTRYFFENYTKQAVAVRKMLRMYGFTIVPIRPTRDMLKAAHDSLMFGENKIRDVVSPLYDAMIKAAPK